MPELTSGKRGFVQELQTFFIENTGKQGKLFTSSESEICVPVEEAVIWTLSGNAWGRYAAIKDIAECKGELIQKRALSIRLMTGKPEDELVADLLDYKKRAETIKDALRKMKKSGSKKSKAKKTTTKRAAAERSTPEAAPKPDPVRSQAISQPIPQTPTPAAEAPLVQSPTRPAAAAPAETKKKETPPPPATPVPPAAEQAVTAPEPPGEISLSDSNTPAAPMVEKDPFFNISILERPSKGGGKEFRAEFEITAPWGAGYFIPTEAKDLFQRVYEGQKEFVIPGPGSPKITISCMPQTEGSVAGLISAGGFKQISKLHSFQVEKCWPFQMTVIIEKGGQQSYGIYTVWFDQSSGLPVAIKDQNSRQKKASEKLKQTGT